MMACRDEGNVSDKSRPPGDTTSEVLTGLLDAQFASATNTRFSRALVKATCFSLPVAESVCQTIRSAPLRNRSLASVRTLIPRWSLYLQCRRPGRQGSLASGYLSKGQE